MHNDLEEETRPSADDNNNDSMPALIPFDDNELYEPFYFISPSQSY